MLIRQLKVRNVRNISQAHLVFENRFSVITGANGAGKSSILEALSLLSNGKSFRSNNVRSLVKRDTSDLTVFVNGQFDDSLFSAGIQKSLSGLSRAKINSELVKGQYKLSELLPIFIIVPGFYDELAAKRSARLRILDWGVFHVEHSFFDVWKNYKSSLKQRNALLKLIGKNRADIRDLEFWTTKLIELGDQLNRFRTAYLELLQKSFHSNNEAFEEQLSNYSLKYRFGHSSDKSLRESLEETLDSDIKRGFTQVGPHRGDLVIRSEKGNAFDFVSRGQQKVLINAVMLGVIKVFSQNTNKECVVCVDDLPSELDKVHQAQLLEALQRLKNTQIIVTAITEDSLPATISGYNRDVFHVEHGVFQVLKDS
ncbi:DNA replication/repair protein RecF [Pleionea sediminis]|uniref:DNA replication/repair protein RecF n=1 Tax=Pleionea sediminis TaxID=2569479 RepID=UPI001186D481|nr:DNA replication and repair protein RecF [Pleionea sediminis]